MTDEKKSRIKELMSKLAQLSDEQKQIIVDKLGLTNPEGHVLTLRNQSLLYLQAEGNSLSVVAGFKQWQKYNRAVRRGERGYLIAVPANNKKADETPNAEDPTFFLWKAVFDISQTEEINNQENKSEGVAA